jgi:hypothetical protein
MNAQTHTSPIEIAIGRELRSYHAYITTALVALDTPMTLTLYAAPLWEVSGNAAVPIVIDAVFANVPARLVLVEEGEFKWQSARYHEAKHLFKSADPVLVGLDTIHHWLWNRMGAPSSHRRIAHA